MKITKAVIPAAGLGTRFLPTTKAIPKEMMPVVDKPVIQYVVEEVVASGITDIIIVTTPQKTAIKSHFSPAPELEAHLEKSKKFDQLEMIKRLSSMAKFTYINQTGPYGNGTPVLCAKNAIGNEPFAVIWGDEFWDCEKPRLRQLLDVFEKYRDLVLTVKDITKEETKKYGVIDGDDLGNGVYKVKSLIEKPGPKLAPSLVGSLGGYVLTPDIFQILKDTPLGKSNELWLVDAIVALAKTHSLYACKIKGTYYDIGSPADWLKANIKLAEKRKDLMK